MSKIKIGLIQVRQRPEDGYAERTELLYSSAEECFKSGADIVFFPEAYQHVPNRAIVNNPEELMRVSGEWKARCSRLARKYHAYLAPWDYEYSEGNVYNSAYILDRNGVEIGRYRKVHLTHSEQKRGLTGGDDFPVFDLDFGRVGIMICWDNYFPESARCLGNRGADLILYPLYGDTLVPAWEIKLRARAVDNSVFIASTQIDGYNTGAFTGLVSPAGEIVYRADMAVSPSVAVIEADIGREQITYTSGNRAYPERIRKYTDRCRRPDAYGGIMEPAGTAPWEEIYFGNPPRVE